MDKHLPNITLPMLRHPATPTFASSTSKG